MTSLAGLPAKPADLRRFSACTPITTSPLLNLPVTGGLGSGFGVGFAGAVLVNSAVPVGVVSAIHPSTSAPATLHRTCHQLSPSAAVGPATILQAVSFGALALMSSF